MSTLSLRKVKHDSSSIDNITLNSDGTTTANAEVIVPSLKGATGNKLQLRSGDSSYGVSLQNVSGIDLVSVDAVGRVTMPYQPAFSCRGFTNTNLGAKTFSSIASNIGSHYSNSTGRFTAPVNGNYFISCSFIVNTGYTSIQFGLKKNGADWAEVKGGDTNGVQIQGWSGVIPLSTNDYIEFVFDGGNTAGPVTGLPFGQFTGFLIG